MEKTEEQIFDEFVMQYTEWAKEGKMPEIASIDLIYSLELQKKRLNEKNISIEYRYVINDESDRELIKKEWHDNRYSNMRACHHYLKTTDYYINGRRKFHNKQNERFYQIITWLNDNNQDANATYVCPNCGAITNVRTLLMEGCQNCGTQFLMSDLYPKVVNYFFAKNNMKSKKGKGLGIKKWMILWALVLEGYNLYINVGLDINSIEQILNSEVITNIIIGTLISALGGITIGYMIWAILRVLTLVIGAIKVSPMIGDFLTTKSKLDDYIKKYDPSFSYEFFVGKVMSLYKTMIFSEDYENLAIYDGEPMKNTFKDIVDVQYRGAIGVNSMQVQDGYIYADIKLFVTNIYCRNNLIKEKNEVYRMVVCKNITKPYDYGFTIRNVQCKNCGGSFNATREHNCPYCQTSYNLKDDDWVVISLKKK